MKKLLMMFAGVCLASAASAVQLAWATEDF